MASLVCPLVRQCQCLSCQDQRELKRIRRKQSNRESARRSRQKKQAECEVLATKVNRLEADNVGLKQENLQLRAKLDVSTSSSLVHPVYTVFVHAGAGLLLTVGVPASTTDSSNFLYSSSRTVFCVTAGAHQSAAVTGKISPLKLSEALIDGLGWRLFLRCLWAAAWLVGCLTRPLMCCIGALSRRGLSLRSPRLRT